MCVYLHISICVYLALAADIHVCMYATNFSILTEEQLLAVTRFRQK